MRLPVPALSFLRLSPILLLAGLARAGVQEHSVQLHVQPVPMPFHAVVNVPLFDSGLGTLVEARLTLTPNVGAVLRAENTDTTLPETVTLVFSSSLALSRGGSTLVTTHSSGYVSQFLLPFDGVLDHAGPSGMTQGVHDTQPVVGTYLPASAEFEAFVGAPGSTDTVRFELEAAAMASCEPIGLPTIAFETRISATPTIQVTYVYTENGAPFCAGDGSGGACPCDNPGLAGHGCSSPATAAGVRLSASGEARVTADTLTFLASDLPSSTVMVLMQGDISAGLGTPFGAGLSCVTGNVRRIATLSAGGSTSIGAVSGGVSIAAVGDVPAAGATRYYQVAYRESPGACNGAPLNFSNGWRVAWRP